jgi:hypothetical protein
MFEIADKSVMKGMWLPAESRLHSDGICSHGQVAGSFAAENVLRQHYKLT